MTPGYAYELDIPHLGWGNAPDERWETVDYRPDGTEQRVGQRYLDGSSVTVYRCSDGAYRAQLTHLLGTR